MILILIVAAAVFVSYAVYAHYQETPASDSIPKRIWASVLAAGAAIGAIVMQWLHSSGTVS